MAVAALPLAVAASVDGHVSVAYVWLLVLCWVVHGGW